MMRRGCHGKSAEAGRAAAVWQRPADRGEIFPTGVGRATVGGPIFPTVVHRMADFEKRPAIRWTRTAIRWTRNAARCNLIATIWTPDAARRPQTVARLTRDAPRWSWDFIRYCRYQEKSPRTVPRGRVKTPLPERLAHRAGGDAPRRAHDGRGEEKSPLPGDRSFPGCL